MTSSPAVPVMQSDPAVPKQVVVTHVTGLQPGAIPAHIAEHWALA